MIDVQSRVYAHTLSDDAPVAVTMSRFPGESGVVEFHLMICPTAYADFATQLAWVNGAYQRACAVLGLNDDTAMFRRIFCSDLSNQTAELQDDPTAAPQETCAISRVRQPPAPPAKVAVWAYHVRVPDGQLEKHREGATVALRRGELTHLWSAGLTAPSAGDSAEQTTAILGQYDTELQARGLTVADHVLRTWFFVQNVDANYQGLVEARKAFFAVRGLTPETHYITSTGIEGAAADLRATVMMDAYAIAGVRGEQMQYLSAPEYLCPTHRYGVTFERGVSIDYRDRRHVLISGTASIDHTGSIVHLGDVTQQLDRTLENIEALLRRAEASLSDVCLYLVYMRDPSDISTVQAILRERCSNAPMLITLAPVCRPGWLIEIECEAIIDACHPTLPHF